MLSMSRWLLFATFISSLLLSSRAIAGCFEDAVEFCRADPIACGINVGGNCTQCENEKSQFKFDLDQCYTAKTQCDQAKTQCDQTKTTSENSLRQCNQNLTTCQSNTCNCSIYQSAAQSCETQKNQANADLNQCNTEKASLVKPSDCPNDLSKCGFSEKVANEVASVATCMQQGRCDDKVLRKLLAHPAFAEAKDKGISLEDLSVSLKQEVVSNASVTDLPVSLKTSVIKEQYAKDECPDDDQGCVKSKLDQQLQDGQSIVCAVAGTVDQTQKDSLKDDKNNISKLSLYTDTTNALYLPKILVKMGDNYPLFCDGYMKLISIKDERLLFQLNFDQKQMNCKDSKKLTVKEKEPENGSVKTLPRGFFGCGDAIPNETCSQYLADEIVTLVAEPAENYEVSDWGCEGSQLKPEDTSANTAKITLTTDTICTPAFTEKTVGTQQDSIPSPTNLDASESASNTSPSSGNNPSPASNDPSSTGVSTQGTTVKLTLSAMNGENSGDVSLIKASPQGSNCFEKMFSGGLVCQYTSGDSVILNTTQNINNFTFDKWTGDCTTDADTSQSRLVVMMDTDKSCVAHFK